MSGHPTAQPLRLNRYFGAFCNSFTGFASDFRHIKCGGPCPASSVRDAAGNLHGTTYGGGAYGAGSVFKVDKTGKESMLYSFCSAGAPCGDGQQPTTGLVMDGAGNLYRTAAGGANGMGVVFKIAPE